MYSVMCSITLFIIVTKYFKIRVSEYLLKQRKTTEAHAAAVAMT